MPGNSIEIIGQVVPVLEPTICGPISHFRELTTVANANTMAWLGFFCGAVMVILFWAGLRYGPIIYDRYLSWKAGKVKP